GLFRRRDGSARQCVSADALPRQLAVAESVAAARRTRFAAPVRFIRTWAHSRLALRRTGCATGDRSSRLQRWRSTRLSRQSGRRARERAAMRQSAMIGIRQLSLVALSLFALSSTWARAGSDFIDLRDMQALEGNAEAGKVRAAACVACPGSAGISPVPLFPNLAGQHAEYMYGRLLQIKREARAESPMTAMVADLDDTAMRDLSVWFASLAAPATA